MVFISKYIQEHLDRGLKTKDVAAKLNITPAMVGQYKLKRGYRPSLTVAITVYKLDGVVLHPFSKESLEWEIANGL